jgi:23S rRNA pseudouridine1911/1915/1917 synthase
MLIEKTSGGLEGMELDDQLNFNDSDDLYEHKVIRVDNGQEPVRIDKFITDRLQYVSRNKVQDAIRHGAVLLDNSMVKPNVKVKPGQIITLVLPSIPKDETVLPAEDIPLNIVYEDDDILIIEKEPGMVVHPGVGNPRGTLVNALAWYLSPDKSALLSNPLTDRPSLVHRIDKDTSGLMVVPKNDFSATFLAKQFFNHSIDREYVALVWGSPDPEQGRIEGNLGRNPKNRLQMIVFPDGELGKHAITHYETIESMYYVSLVKCRLETGRTHQIRAHMKYIGHTLFNDSKYGGNEVLKGTLFSKYKQFVQNCFTMLPRHALHARLLGFIHPRTGKKMIFESPIPDDMNSVIVKWRNYVDSRKELLQDE